MGQITTSLGFSVEPDLTGLDAEAKRTIRALTTRMLVIPSDPEDGVATGVYWVHSESGERYGVDLETSTCTCPDHTHRGTECKHLKRCQMLVDSDVSALPAPGDKVAPYRKEVAGIAEELSERIDTLNDEIERLADEDADDDERWEIRQERNRLTMFLTTAERFSRD